MGLSVGLRPPSPDRDRSSAARSPARGPAVGPGPGSLLALQRAAGNRAVAGLLGASPPRGPALPWAGKPDAPGPVRPAPAPTVQREEAGPPTGPSTLDDGYDQARHEGRRQDLVPAY